MLPAPARARCGLAVPPSWPALSAALLTTLVAVVLDVSAGADPGHTVGLGVAALAVGLVRMHRFGRRHRVLVALLCGLVVAQPLLHLVVSVWHHAVASLGSHHAPWMHGALLAAHLVPAGAVLVAVALADVLLAAGAERITRLVRALLLLPAGPAREPLRRCTVTLGPVAELRTWAEYACRRGPPGARSLAITCPA